MNDDQESVVRGLKNLKYELRDLRLRIRNGPPVPRKEDEREVDRLSKIIFRFQSKFDQAAARLREEGGSLTGQEWEELKETLLIE